MNSPATYYNINPQPQGGNGAYGAVPGPLGMPDPSGDLTKQLPNLPQANAAASGDILSKLDGTLSPGTMNALQNAAATHGVASGMPGSGLSWNSLYGNIAGASEAQQQQGLQDYSSLIPTVSGTQTVSPGLQTEIATQNSLNAAAPNPTQAANHAQQLFNQYLQQMRGPGGGTSGRSGPSGVSEIDAAYNRQYGPEHTAWLNSLSAGGNSSSLTAKVNPNLPGVGTLTPSGDGADYTADDLPAIDDENLYDEDF